MKPKGLSIVTSHVRPTLVLDLCTKAISIVASYLQPAFALDLYKGATLWLILADTCQAVSHCLWLHDYKGIQSLSYQEGAATVCNSVYPCSVSVTAQDCYHL